MVTQMYTIHWECVHGESETFRIAWLVTGSIGIHIERYIYADRLRAVPGTERWMKDLGQEVKAMRLLAEKTNACAERIQEIMKRRPDSYETRMARIEEARPHALWKAARFLATLSFCLLAWPQR